MTFYKDKSCIGSALRKIRTSTLITLLMAAAVPNSFSANQTSVAIQIDPLPLRDNLNVPLFSGGPGDGDGFAIQLGYYDAATTLNNFLGNWIALTGQNSDNTDFATSSIGDGDGGDGQLFSQYVFDSTIPNTFQDLPASDNVIPLTIRFYNAVLISNATLFNAVSKDTWLWRTPAPSATVPPQISMFLTSANQSTLEWQGGAPSAFKTTVAIVPEPATAALLVFGVAGLLGRRRRA
jgi:hypothetical protein